MLPDSIIRLVDGSRRLFATAWLLVVVGLVAAAVFTWWRQDDAHDRAAGLLAERIDRLLIDTAVDPADQLTSFAAKTDGHIRRTNLPWLIGFDTARWPAFGPAAALVDGERMLVRSRDPATRFTAVFLLVGTGDGWRATALPIDRLGELLAGPACHAELRGTDGGILAGEPVGRWWRTSRWRPFPAVRGTTLVTAVPAITPTVVGLLLAATAWFLLGLLPLRRLGRQQRRLEREQRLIDRTVSALVEGSRDRREDHRTHRGLLRTTGRHFLAECHRLRPTWDEHRLHLNLLQGLVRNILRLVDGVEAEEERKRLSEERLAVTLDCIAEAVITTDVALAVVTMNPAAEELTGWRTGDAAGRPLAEVLRVDGDDAMLICQDISESMAANRVHQARDPVVIVSRDGTTRSIVGSSAPLVAAGDITGSVIILHDVSDLLRLEEQLRRSQKLETVGQLAGGIAHDFNNLLTSIIGFAEQLKREVAQEPELRAKTKKILTAARRAAEMTGRLLSFSRKQEPERHPIDAHRIIREAIDLLQQSVPRSIELETRLLAHHPGVLSTKGNLLNVCINLGLNARDAMGEKGRLIYATRNVVAGHDHGTGIAPGTPCLEISVCDTGCGIDPDVLPHIFEPLYTTKAAGQGTGLGLSTVYNLVSAGGGVIHADSTPGHGTTFCIVLPNCEDTTFSHTRSTTRQHDAADGEKREAVSSSAN